MQEMHDPNNGNGCPCVPSHAIVKQSFLPSLQSYFSLHYTSVVEPSKGHNKVSGSDTTYASGIHIVCVSLSHRGQLKLVTLLAF